MPWLAALTSVHHGLREWGLTQGSIGGCESMHFSDLLAVYRRAHVGAYGMRCVCVCFLYFLLCVNLIISRDKLLDVKFGL